MSTDNEKVAAQVPVMMQTAAQHLRKMAADNVDLVKRADSAEREVRLYKLARRMEVRGIEPNLSFEDKVAKLGDIPEEKLARMEQAIELAAGGVRLGTVGSVQTDTDGKTAGRGELYKGESDGSDTLDNFIESQGAFG